VTFWDSIDTRVTGVENAVPTTHRAMDTATRRAHEFRAGRACAMAAIRGIRFGAVDLIGVDITGAPVWPSGIVGSISHSSGRAAAAVSADPDILALGIDIERARIFDPNLAALVCRVDDETAAAGIFGPSVAFGAKESVFKAWSPLTGSWLDFDDIRVRLSRDGGFDVLVSADGFGPGWHWTGQWQIDNGIVRTAAVLSRTVPPAGFEPATKRLEGSCSIP
jgi:4'-phosphopantetheinyl transferase EntD